ncbi:uncharacterized protein LOC144642799 [Oculina patagonica]
MKFISILLLFMWNADGALPQKDPPKVMLPASTLRVLPGYELSCPSTGTRPIYTALISNSRVLVNTTKTAKIVLRKEGNYTCVATSKYGNDVGEVEVIFRDCESCSYLTGGPFGVYVQCNYIAFPGDIVKCVPTTTGNLGVFSSNLSNMSAGMLSGLSNLRMLEIRSNSINFLPEKIFDKLSKLTYLDLSSNALTYLPDKLFYNLGNLDYLILFSNSLTFLPDKLFKSLKYLLILDLRKNAIEFLPEKIFVKLRNLEKLYLASNALTTLPGKVFHKLNNLLNLDLSSNSITLLPERVLANQKNLKTFDLSHNKMEYLPNGLFCCLTELKHLYLQNNNITIISKEIFANATNIQFLFLSGNKLENIPQRAFFNLVPRSIATDSAVLEHVLMFSDNPIKTIEPEAFMIFTFHLGIHM